MWNFPKILEKVRSELYQTFIELVLVLAEKEISRKMMQSGKERMVESLEDQGLGVLGHMEDLRVDMLLSKYTLPLCQSLGVSMVVTKLGMIVQVLQGQSCVTHQQHRTLFDYFQSY